MENAEEILQCLDEFSKLKPKDIPRELEDYLCFVAKTGDPVYQWSLIKCLFREKLLSVITEFYETCPSVEIPPCPNVDAFNYDAMKVFILEKLDTFAAAPFTVQRICELLTSPRKEYNRIDKYMRALEKNILVVSTREPGNRKSTENGESVVNGLESEHVSEINSDINVEVEMDETASVWAKTDPSYSESNIILDTHTPPETIQDTYVSESKTEPAPCGSNIETVITTRPMNYIGYTPNITDLIIDPSITTTEPSITTTEPEEPRAPVDASINIFAMATEPIIPTEPPEVVKAHNEAEPAYSVPLETEPTLVQIEPLVRNSEPESTENLIIDTEPKSPVAEVEPVVPTVEDTFQQIPTVVQSMVQPISAAVQSLILPIAPIVETVVQSVGPVIEPEVQTIETMVEPEIQTIAELEIETVDIKIKPVVDIVQPIEAVEPVQRSDEPVQEMVETIQPAEEMVQLVETTVKPVVESMIEPVEEIVEAVTKTDEPIEVQPIQIVESSVQSLVETVEPVEEVIENVVQVQEVETSAAALVESSILITSEAVTEMTITSTDDLKHATDTAPQVTQPELPKVELAAVVESTVPDDAESEIVIETSLPVVEVKPAQDEGMEVDEIPADTEEITPTEVPTSDVTRDFLTEDLATEDSRG